MDEAATMPVVFMTVIHSLRQLARLTAGETVLIHAAAGGVGLAALQVAKKFGAEVFATAGTPEKRAYLESLGVKHVMDSRSLTFADEVRAITAGRGVDVVLNSLSGEAMMKSLELLAPYGRFVELGKRDLYSDRQIGLTPFRKGVAYMPVDVGELAIARPDQFRALWKEVVAEISAGVWQPLRRQVVSIGEAVNAFRDMAQAKHIGKIVFTFDERANVRIAARSPVPATVNRSGSYLITGGLGGLGLTIAQWLVGQGARNLILLSRSKPSPEAKAVIMALESTGARVLATQADVAQRSEMQRVLEDISAQMAPLCGVFHAAGILDDGLLLRIDGDRLSKVMAPKVEGAWNLHVLTSDLPLEWFVMFSSAASLLGSPGQGNYAAANAFMDTLAHHRRARGLPALSINWGPWSEVGAAARPDRGGRMALRGVQSLTPAQGLDALQMLLGIGGATATSPIQVAVLDFNLRQWRAFYPKVAESTLLSHLLTNDATDVATVRESSIKGTLLAAEPAQRLGMLEVHLKEQLAQGAANVTEPY
jgi:NADPH:quinone reductase-like Zn-dependent oxidoreductase